MLYANFNTMKVVFEEKIIKLVFNHIVVFRCISFYQITKFSGLNEYLIVGFPSLKSFHHQPKKLIFVYQ